MELFEQPVAGIPIEKPETPPLPGKQLLGYKVIPRSDKFMKKPEPHKMRPVGWGAVVCLAIVCWPLSCVPCCLSYSYPEYTQVPVYES